MYTSICRRKEARRHDRHPTRRAARNRALMGFVRTREQPKVETASGRVGDEVFGTVRAMDGAAGASMDGFTAFPKTSSPTRSDAVPG